MFFCEYCKIFKNSYFEEDLQTTIFLKNISHLQPGLKLWLHFGKIQN